MNPSIGRRAAGLLLAAIVVLSLAVATVWLVRVPIFGEPDEVTHADYALTLWSAGRPISAREHPSGTNVSPDTRALARAGSLDTLRFSATGRVPTGYGTASYWHNVDRTAPADRGWYARATEVPYIVAVYPLGYYALAAAAFGTTRAITGSLVAAFFAMRATGLVLLACLIVLTYATAREYRYSRSIALALAATVGLFPEVDVSFSYVQPDDLAIVLVFTVLLVTLRIRRLGVTTARFVLLGLALAALAMTKLHVFGATTLGIAIPLAFALGDAKSTWRHRAALAAIALVPSVPTALYSMGLEHHAPTTHDYTHFSTRLATEPPSQLIGEALRVGFTAFATIYGGYAGLEYFRDFACVFTPISFGSPGIDTALDVALSLGTYAVMICVLLHAMRAVRVALARGRKHGAVSAVRLLAHDPEWNLYLIYLGVVIVAEMYVDGLILVQGRYMLPTIFGALLCAVRYAPRALRPAWRRPLARVAIAALLGYSVVAAGFGLRAIGVRFYDAAPPEQNPVETGIALLTLRPAGTKAPYAQRVARGVVLEGAGFAYDTRSTTVPPLRADLDGRLPVPLRTRLPSAIAIDQTNDERLIDSGYTFVIPTAKLSPGMHTLGIYALERGRWIPSKETPIHLEVTSP